MRTKSLESYEAELQEKTGIWYTLSNLQNNKYRTRNNFIDITCPIHQCTFTKQLGGLLALYQLPCDVCQTENLINNSHNMLRDMYPTVKYILSNKVSDIKTRSVLIDVTCPIHECTITHRLNHIVSGITLPCKICSIPPRNSEALRPKYNTHKCNSKRRGIKYELTFEEWLVYSDVICKYCNMPNSTRGIDRIDNTDHYHSGNVIPCCATCNRLKLTNSFQEFIKTIDRLCTRVLFWDTLFLQIPYQEIQLKINTVWSRCKRRASEKGLTFEITKGYVNFLLTLPCLYCGGPPTGLDRVDNRFGYIVGNVVPCCEQCNSGKMNMSYFHWREYVINAKFFRHRMSQPATVTTTQHLALTSK